MLIDVCVMIPADSNDDDGDDDDDDDDNIVDDGVEVGVVVNVVGRSPSMLGGPCTFPNRLPPPPPTHTPTLSLTPHHTQPHSRVPIRPYLPLSSILTHLTHLTHPPCADMTYISPFPLRQIIHASADRDGKEALSPPHPTHYIAF